MGNFIDGIKTFGRYSITIIIGLLWVTAPRNWTTFGCLIFWRIASSSLKALLHRNNSFKRKRSNNNNNNHHHHHAKTHGNIVNSHFLLICKYFLLKLFHSNFSSTPRCQTESPLTNMQRLLQVEGLENLKAIQHGVLFTKVQKNVFCKYSTM